MGRALRLWLFLAALAASPASGQSQGLVVRDGGLAVGPGTDPLGQSATYLITPEMGQQRGSNLFHSFESFGIGARETATFTGPDSIDGPQSVSNVISRVTGGNESQIDGTLRSTIPGADLWLLNPSGVVFGEGARLDVPGSFHASTGDYLGFGEGGLERFYGDPSRPGVLSTAAPVAFGFLSASGATALAVTGATLAVPEGEALELVGGDVSLTGAELLAPDGLVSLGAQGAVELTGSLVDVGVDGGAPGAVSIRAGRLVMTEGSQVLAENEGAGLGGEISITAGESLVVDDGLLSVATHSAGDAGAIRLRGGDVVFRNGTGASAIDLPQTVPVGASAETTASGAAGTIEVEAESLTLADAILAAQTVGAHGVEASGAAGTIRIRAETVLLERGLVAAGSWASRGDAGAIEIDATAIVVDGSGGSSSTLRDRFRFAGITTSSVAPTSGFGDDPGQNLGDPGTIEIRAESIAVRNRAVVISECLDCISRAERGDHLGHVSIRTEGMVVEAVGPEGRAFVGTGSLGDVGDAGTLEIEAGSLELVDGGLLRADASAGGNGGLVRVEADSVLLSDTGRISAFSLGQGDAGAIEIVAGSVELNRGQIDTNSFGPGGAGTIVVSATDSIRLSNEGGERFSLVGILLGTSVANGIGSATVGGGQGGSITLEAPEITVTDGAIVATSTVGGGDGGELVLRGERIRIANGAFVDTTSLVHPLTGLPGGAAGSITLEATGSIEVVGHHPVFGDVSRVASATMGSGAAGAVMLVAPRILVDGGAVATTAAAFPTGAEGLAGGAISLEAAELLVRGGGRVDASSFVAGPGGRIEATAHESILVTGAGSGIASRTGAGGPGGRVTLSAPRIEVAAGGEVSARSEPGLAEVGKILAILVDEQLIRLPPLEATGDAGTVTLAADKLRLIGGTIATNAEAADGGSITIDANDLLHLDAGVITAAVRDGAGGNISIDPDVVILQNGSRIVADAGTGSGGNIQITADNYFAFPGSLVDASSDLGIDGIVEVSTPDVDLAGTLTALPASYLDASSLMRERCAARRSGERAGSFAVRGNGGIPAEPDGWLPASATLEVAPGSAATSGRARWDASVGSSSTPRSLLTAREGCR